MKIFLAGATGAVGQALVPLLTSHGHTVIGTTRSPPKMEAAAHARRRAGRGRRPRPRRPARRRRRRPPRRDRPPDDGARRRPRPAQVRALVRATNRLRTEGTDHLLAAAREAGVERVVAQSFAAGPRARRRAGQDRGRPARPATPQAGAHDARGDPPARGVGHRRRRDRAALRRLLRPRHRASRPAASSGRWSRRASSRWSATAAACGRSSTSRTSAGGTLAALERGTPGRIYNIVDDEPAPVREWLPAVAEAIGAPPPRHLPRWVGRLIGEHSW